MQGSQYQHPLPLPPLPQHTSTLLNSLSYICQYLMIYLHVVFIYRIMRLCLDLYCKNPYVLDPLRQFIILPSNKTIR